MNLTIEEKSHVNTQRPRPGWDLVATSPPRAGATDGDPNPRNWQEATTGDCSVPPGDNSDELRDSVLDPEVISAQSSSCSSWCWPSNVSHLIWHSPQRAGSPRLINIHSTAFLLSINFNLLYTGCPFYLLLILSQKHRSSIWGLRLTGI